MSRKERDKGSRGEGEVARVYRGVGFDVDRVPNSGGLRIKGDIHGDAPEHIEVKRQEVLRSGLWVRQAEAECAGLPWVVAYRQNNTPWYAITELERHVALVRCHAILYEGAAA